MMSGSKLLNIIWVNFLFPNLRKFIFHFSVKDI
jgi:hypothetical protein